MKVACKNSCHRLKNLHINLLQSSTIHLQLKNNGVWRQILRSRWKGVIQLMKKTMQIWNKKAFQWRNIVSFPISSLKSCHRANTGSSPPQFSSRPKIRNGSEKTMNSLKGSTGSLTKNSMSWRKKSEMILCKRRSFKTSWEIKVTIEKKLLSQ